MNGNGSEKTRLKGASLRITPKGLAFVAAVKADLLPRDDQGNVDIRPFEQFWSNLQETGFFDDLRSHDLGGSFLGAKARKSQTKRRRFFGK